METTRFDFNGWKIPYTAKGQSDIALIFVHGASSSKEIWKYLTTAFAEHFEVLALDLLGHGESEKPETFYCTDLWAKNIKALIDHRGIKKAVLAGHSYGVLVIKQFYALYPSFVHSLILVDGNLKQVLPDGIYNWMKTTLDRPDYEAYMSSLNQNKQAFCLKKSDAELVSEAVTQTPKYVLKGQLESMRAEKGIDINISVPVFAFYAKRHEWTEETERYLRRHAESLELHVWEDVSHFIMLEEPKRLIEVIRQHLIKL